MMPSLIAMALAAAAPVPPCNPAQLSLWVDARDGDFNGMSHSGTLLLMRNRDRACRIEALPRLSFVDAAWRTLPIARNAPVGMHPGPVVVPLTIPAGGVVSTPLRWVSGEVYDHSRCFDPVRVKVAIGGGRLATALSAHICGPAGKPAGFDQPPLRPGQESSAPG